MGPDIKKIKALNRLYKHLIRDEYLFKKASDFFPDDKLSSIFEGYFKHRTKFKEQLIKAIENLGGKPSNGSFRKLNDFWEKVKTVPLKKKERLIIKKCNEQESVIADDYAKVILAADIKLEIKDILLEHYKNFRSTQEKLRNELALNKRLSVA